jgi:hypothetical protein
MRSVLVWFAVVWTSACSTWPPTRTKAAEENADRRFKLARRRYYALKELVQRGAMARSPNVARALERVGPDLEIVDDVEDWAKAWGALVEAESLLDAAHAP